MRGFALVFSVVLISALLTLGGIIVQTALQEADISQDQGESLKAFFAADTAVACVEYYHWQNSAFEEKASSVTYDCGIGDLTVQPNLSCTDRDGETYTYTFDDFDGNQCAVVDVTITDNSYSVDGTDYEECGLHIVANGRNDCDSPAIESTRWKSVGI